MIILMEHLIFRIVLIVFCGVKAIGGESRVKVASISQRVYGGKYVADDKQWPWISAFILKQNENFFCAGSLISKQHILSGVLNSGEGM